MNSPSPQYAQPHGQGPQYGLPHGQAPLPSPHPQPQPPGAAKPPRALRFAAASWLIAGVLTVLVPVVATLLLWLQYQSLRRGAYRLGDIADWVDRGNALDLEPYFAEFERLEIWLFESSGFLLALFLVLYLVCAAMILAIYALVCRFTARGANWARILGVVLAALSTPFVFVTWQFFLALAWIPVDALWSNHLGIVIMTLHITGIILVFVPSSNAYVQVRRAAQEYGPAQFVPPQPAPPRPAPPQYAPPPNEPPGYTPPGGL